MVGVDVDFELTPKVLNFLEIFPGGVSSFVFPARPVQGECIHSDIITMERYGVGGGGGGGRVSYRIDPAALHAHN